MVYDHTLIIELEKFIALCRQYDELYIYGAAENQKLLAKYLRICEINIKGFVISTMLNDLEHTSSKKTGFILGLSDKYYNEIWKSLLQYGITEIIFLPEFVKQVIAYKLRPRKAEEMNIEFNLVDHCNLNCQMCDHFSQIANQGFLDLSVFENDIRRLSELVSKLGSIKLLGGEPLLHSQATDFCIIARKYFLDTPIKFYTNGLLLLNPKCENFWKVCFECNISIELTKYPIPLNYEKILQKAHQHNVVLNIFSEEANRETKEVKHSLKFQLDPSGQQPKLGFIDCYQMNNCSVLSHGKLYLFPTVACIEHFNSFFVETFNRCEADSINIFAVNSFEEIADFASHPVPFCRYCDVRRREFYPWKPSTKKIEEYL